MSRQQQQTRITQEKEMFPALSGASSTPSPPPPSVATQQSESFVRADAAKKRKEQKRLDFLARKAKQDARKEHKRAALIQAHLKKNPYAHIRCILLWYMMLLLGGEDLRTEKDLEEDRAFREAEWAEQEQQEKEEMAEDLRTEKYLQKCEEDRALAKSEGRLKEYEEEEDALYEYESMTNYFACQSKRDIIKKDAIRCPFCHECNNLPQLLA